jgi:RNA polymerase primary sigma factor
MTGAFSLSLRKKAMIKLDSFAVKQILDKFPDCLSQREHQIIKSRFGLLDSIKRTLQQIGNELGISRERVRQIEKRALRKLRHPSRLKKLDMLK